MPDEKGHEISPGYYLRRFADSHYTSAVTFTVPPLARGTDLETSLCDNRRLLGVHCNDGETFTNDIGIGEDVQIVDLFAVKAIICRRTSQRLSYNLEIYGGALSGQIEFIDIC